MLMSHGKLTAILQYFTDKIDDYWHILYPVVPEKIREKDKYLYFYDISRKATDYKGKFSNNGIYLFYGYDGKYHIHPLEIAQYSLACWLAWRKYNDENWVKKALVHCNWLIENQYKDGSWKIEHKNPIYFDLSTPWPSALAQGFAISSLLRAYYYTDEKIFLESAKKACEFLEKDIKDGGVKRIFKIKEVEAFIYEEYPRKKLSGVLNGYISAILSVYELSLLEKDYEKLFLKNLKNLKNLLPLYDCGYWSFYSLDGNISSGFYHRLVVKQLKVLSQFDKDFIKNYRLFYSYQNNKLYALKALIKKIRGNANL